MIKNAFLTSTFIFIAVILGSVVGTLTTEVGILSDAIDYLILALVFLVFADMPIDKLALAIKQPKVLLIAWLTNFLILPFLGFGLTQLMLPDQPWVAIGLAVYFMSPCTDWFLGFTRMAKGNTALGGVLLPINLLTQLLLYPFFVQWFSQHSVASVSAAEISTTLFEWFAEPALAAFALKLCLFKHKHLLDKLSSLTNWVIYALVFCIFAYNIEELTKNTQIVGIILLTVVIFFVISGLFTEVVTKKLHFSKEDHVLYTMTTTARNAPLMLGITMTAIPDQPLIYATLVVGMLLEFPYLAIQVMRFNAKGKVIQPISSLANNASFGHATIERS